MVGINQKKEIAHWWNNERKIECAGALLLLIVLITFWENPLVEGGAGIFASFWCLGKIYFRRDKWPMLLLAAVILFRQGISILLRG